MAVTACPMCGETEDLRGATIGEDIEVLCLTCRARFRRGTAQCRRCGRTDPVHGSQRMTRARGTLLAVVGMREVPLCRSCDGEIAARVLDRGQLVPEGYASRFVRGEVDEALPVSPESTRRHTPAPTSSPPPKQVTRSGTVSAPHGPVQAPPVTSKPQDPTVRQATEAFLQQATESVDSLCLVLLGAELGPSTRLSRLDHQAAESVAAGLCEKFGEGASGRRDQAVATVIDLVDHWLREGWLCTDLAAGLRRTHLG